MKRLWLIILMLAPLAVSAQQVVVSGIVKDDKTGVILKQVSVSAGRVSVVTNEDGVFVLKGEDREPEDPFGTHYHPVARNCGKDQQPQRTGGHCHQEDSRQLQPRA